MPRAGSRRVRVVGLLVSLSCAAILMIAGSLHGDSRGYDTHTQLGLPSCSFVQNTGMPCPMCGMTTAFAHMAHGQVVRALRAQTFGVALFMATVIAGAAGAIQAVTGRAVLAGFRPRSWWLWIGIAAIVVGWLIKIGVGLATGELPVH